MQPLFAHALSQLQTLSFAHVQTRARVNPAGQLPFSRTLSMAAALYLSHRSGAAISASSAVHARSAPLRIAGMQQQPLLTSHITGPYLAQGKIIHLMDAQWRQLAILVEHASARERKTGWERSCCCTKTVQCPFLVLMQLLHQNKKGCSLLTAAILGIS